MDEDLELVPLENIEDGSPEESREDEEDMFAFSDGDPECSPQRTSRWGSLPHMCLRHVFVFLSDHDRTSAELVCRHWHHVMRSPCLWRARFFYFSGRLSKTSKSQDFVAAAYAHSLGVYLERLEVCVYPPRKPLAARRLEQSISGLLSELYRVNAPLRSLSLRNLELDRACWTSGLRRSLGLQLLSALSFFKRSHYPEPRSSIASLDLTGFFSRVLPIHLNPALPRALNRLQGFVSLSLSYSCLSDELLIALQPSPNRLRHYSYRDGTLQTLSLQCSFTENHSQLVHGDSWATLASSCPDLKVKLMVDQVIDITSLKSILLPEIPLTEYSMTALYPPDEIWSVKPLLMDILPQFRSCLQCLNLNLCNCTESLAEELLELVKVCERLEQLSISAFLEVSIVERLLNIRLTQKSSLNKISVKVYTISDELGEQEDQLQRTLSCYPHLPPELQFFATIYPFGVH